MKDKINFNNLNQLIFYSIPLALILSNFLANAAVIYLSIYGIYQIFLNRNFEVLKNNLVKIFILFCVFISINALILDVFLLSIKSSFSFIRYLFFIIGVYYLYKKNYNLFLNFFIIYLFILIFLFIDANYQIINEGINVFGFNSYYIQSERISSIFFEELILGSYVQKFTILTVCYLYCFYKKNLNYLTFAILIISIEICFISGERTALFSIILFFFTFIIFFMDISKFKKFIFLTSSIIIFLILIVQNPNVKNRIFTNTLENISSSNYIYFSPGHKNHLDVALNLFKNKPISGYGSNTFRIACHEVQNKLKIIGCSTHPHNLVAQFLAEKGIIGLIFLLFFYLYIISNLFKSLINFDQSIHKKKALILFSILILFNPLFPSPNFYNSWVNNIIFIIFTYCFIIGYNKIKNV